VASLMSWIWNLLTTPVLGSPGCEWLPWQTGFGPCLQHLSLALQFVSGFLGELDFNPADNACPWLSSLWVASVVSHIWTLLTMPVLGSSVCEWLLW